MGLEEQPPMRKTALVLTLKQGLHREILYPLRKDGKDGDALNL
jgi:hypothetical protein